MMTHKRSFQHQCAIRQMAFCLGKDEVPSSNLGSSSRKGTRECVFSFCITRPSSASIELAGALFYNSNIQLSGLGGSDARYLVVFVLAGAGRTAGI